MTQTHSDFQTLWEKAVRSSDRLDAATDLAFWEGYAPNYDRRIGSDGERVTLDHLRTIVRPTDSLLDVGAGTGRFAIPLSAHVSRITALDHSPDMLGVLREKCAAAGIATIDTLEAEWPHLEVEPHDVVLAAWSLYRIVDLKAALAACVSAARRALVIALGIGGLPPHRRHVAELWGRWNESSVPGHLYVAGALWEMGHWADAQVLTARRSIVGESPTEVARALAPLDAADSDVEKLATALGPLIRKVDSQYQYLFDYGVGVVTWSRNDEVGVSTAKSTETP